jgi:hypothetical protein
MSPRKGMDAGQWLAALVLAGCVAGIAAVTLRNTLLHSSAAGPGPPPSPAGAPAVPTPDPALAGVPTGKRTDKRVGVMRQIAVEDPHGADGKPLRCRCGVEIAYWYRDVEPDKEAGPYLDWQKCHAGHTEDNQGRFNGRLFPRDRGR